MQDDELPLGTGEAPATYVSHLESDLLSLIGMLERHANLGKRTVQIGQVRRAAALVTQDLEAIVARLDIATLAAKPESHLLTAEEHATVATARRLREDMTDLLESLQPTEAQSRN
jgi:hypothetical protein